MPARSLARYADELSPGEDRWNLRLLAHEFGLVWQHADASERRELIEQEPEPTGDVRWDAFLAAYAEHLAFHAHLSAPAWTAQARRHLETLWFPLTADLPTLRVEALVHAPASFEAHGILVARRELEVV